MSERSVLHLLPHGGAGGERYIELLEGMPGFRFERMALSEGRNPVAAAARVPAVGRAARRHDLLHVHGDAAAILCLPLLGRRRSVVTLHGLHLLSRSRGAGGRAVARLLRSALLRARTAICVSHSELEQARRQLGADLRLELIVNGVELPAAADPAVRKSERSALGLDEGELAVLFAGALDQRKDPMTLARAVAIARGLGAEVTGLVAGDGPLRGELEAAPGIRVLGQRPDLGALFAAADAFSLPSRREGLSLALLEAMAAGLAPVVSDGPGNPEAVGAAGIVHPRGDAEALAEALRSLAGDRERRRRLGRAASERAASEFSAERMREQTRRAYLRALGEPEGASRLDDK